MPNSHHLKLCLWMIIAVAIWPAIGLAQAALSLNQAIKLALSNHETVAIAEWRAYKQQAERLEAWSRVLPRANASALQQWQQPVFRQINGADVLVQGASTRSYNFGADLTLLDAAAIANAMGTGDLLHASQAELVAAKLDLAYAVAEAYVGAYAAGRLVIALEERVRVAAQAVSEASLRLRAGLAAPIQQKRIELEQASAQVELAQARADHRSLQNVLLELLVLESLPTLTEPTLAKPITANNTSWQNRPDLKSLALKAQAAQATLNGVWLDYLPTLGVGADWRSSNEAGIASNPDHWSLFAGAYWLLFDGVGRIARLRARTADAKIAQLNYSAALRQAKLNIVRIEGECDAAQALLILAQNQLRLAKQSAQETLLRFKNNLATGLELADALAEQHIATANLVKHKLYLDLTYLRLAYTLGQWPVFESNLLEIYHEQ